MDASVLNIAMYMAVNLLLFSSWYLLLFGKRDSLSFADRVTGAFTAGLAQIIATELVLGVVFRQLFAGPLFTLNVLISSGVLAAALRVPSGERGAGSALKSAFVETRDEALRIAKIITGDRALLCVFTLFFIMLCWMVFLGYLFPSYTWDSLWVHLPSVGYTLQNGAIQVNPAYSFIDIVVNVLPQNIDLFFVWNVIFLKSSTLVDLSPLAFTLAGMLTIYSMAAKLGMREDHAIWASLLFFFTPVILLLSVSNYVDVPVAVLFLVAVNFLMYGTPGYRPGDTGKLERAPVLISGVATGILLGTKGSGPLFVAVLSIAIIIQEAVRHVKQYGRPLRPVYFAKKALMPYAALFILPALLWGGYWYIKNWVVYDNPLYTTDISVMNVTIFKGLFKGIIDPAPEVITKLTPLGRLFYVWLERVPYYLYDSRLSGFGPMWFVLFLPAAAFAVLHAVKRGKYGFLFASAILIFTFVIYPRNWYTRYVIYIVALGPLSFGMTLDYFGKRAKILKAAALLLVCYTFLTANSPCIMPEKIREFIHLPPGERTIARLAPFNIDVHAREEYGYWTWISRNVREGDTLAYTFDPLFLTPLWNGSFSNRIIYIRADTYKAWLKELEKNNTTYVVIKRNSTEGRWIGKEKRLLARFGWLGAMERLENAYADDHYMIMRLAGSR